MADRRQREAVGAVVRHLRGKRDLSQTELAERAGLAGLGWQVSKLETARWADDKLWEVLEQFTAPLGTTRQAVDAAAAELVRLGRVPVATAEFDELIARVSGPRYPPAVKPVPPTPTAALQPVVPPSSPALPGRGKPVRRREPQAETTTHAATLEHCIDLAETHLLSRLEEGSDTLDPFEVHALALALEHLEGVKDRREARSTQGKR